MGAAIAPIAGALISAGGAYMTQKEVSKTQAKLQDDSQKFQQQQQDRASAEAAKTGPARQAANFGDMQNLKRKQLGSRGILSTVYSNTLSNQNNESNILGG